MSLGSDRVRGSFNPSNDDVVANIKARTADLIDLCEQGKGRDQATSRGQPQSSEAIRLWALAQTAYEEAAMWAVKAATAERP